MTDAELADWLPTSFDAYVAERVRIGEPEAHARRRADAQWAEFFPGGRPAARHELFVLDDDGERAGMIWIGPYPRREGDARAAWLFDIEIDEGRRGKGNGRAAIRLIQQHLAAQGVTELGLNVFGDNVTARHLYARAGFRETSVVMTKKLVAPPH